MSQQDLVKQFPSRRIKPFDGMVVTAEVWEEAHEYHHQRQRFHSLLNHGAGILTGLEVIASDPPDSSVYILPGIALDAAGQTIVLPEPLAYDLGGAQGALYVLLSYGEGQPRPDEHSTESAGASTDIALFIQAQYSLEAAGVPPAFGGSQVELARVRRQGAKSPITNANDAMRPGLNQIDLRFRHSIGVATRDVASIAVCYLAGTSEDSVNKHGRGASYLARALRQAGTPVWVDDSVPLVSNFDLHGYTLLYLVAQGGYQLSPDEMNAVYAYVQGGGTLLFESCRQESGASDTPADAAFFDMLSSFGVKLDDLPAGHKLLTEPNLFAALPSGFETERESHIKLSDSVIFSNCDYGCLWQGERRGRPASREEIRAATEWGGNLVAYAIERHKQAQHK